jgi:serine/threonine protein kinase
LTDSIIGKTLSHHTITAKLGAGGMGDVYAADDTELGRQVALKVLPPTMATDPERLERFKREARAVASLNLPNIVTIHSVEEEDGIHFLTMELVAGKSLDRSIPDGTRSASTRGSRSWSKASLSPEPAAAAVAMCTIDHRLSGLVD